MARSGFAIRCSTGVCAAAASSSRKVLRAISSIGLISSDPVYPHAVGVRASHLPALQHASRFLDRVWPFRGEYPVPRSGCTIVVHVRWITSGGCPRRATWGFRLLSRPNQFRNPARVDDAIFQTRWQMRARSKPRRSRTMGMSIHRPLSGSCLAWLSRAALAIADTDRRLQVALLVRTSPHVPRSRACAFRTSAQGPWPRWGPASPVGHRWRPRAPISACRSRTVAATIRPPSSASVAASVRTQPTAASSSRSSRHLSKTR